VLGRVSHAHGKSKLHAYAQQPACKQHENYLAHWFMECDSR